MSVIHTHRVREEPVHYTFLAILLLYFGYHYYLTLSFGVQASSTIPQIVIYLSVILIILDGVLKTTILGDIVKTHVSGGSQLEDRLMSGEEDGEAGTESTFSELEITKLLAEFGWVLSYCVAILFIGFFTSTLVYLFTYLFVKINNQSPFRRTLVAGSYSILLTGFVYVLYIELLSVVSLFGFGILI